MKNFYSLLQDIKNNPVMYLGKPSITCLDSFLNGYLSTLSDLGFTREGSATDGFQAWLQEREKTTVSRSWLAILLFINGSERSTFYRFFELFDEFLKQKESSKSEKDEAVENYKSRLNDLKPGIYNPYKLLGRIKKRPGMYLGTSSITRLDMVLRGYTLARREVGLEPTDEEIEFEGFQSWLTKKYEIKSNQSWSKIILFYSIDEQEALEKFFELFEEYQNQNKSLEVEEKSKGLSHLWSEQQMKK